MIPFLTSPHSMFNAGRSMLNVPFLFLLAVSATQAQPDRDKQESEIVSVPGGAIFHRWYGHAGRTYFIQVSDPNNSLAKWT